MFLSRFFDNQEVNSTRHRRPGRRPLVEALEGRRLLSTLTVTNAASGNQISSDIVGNHIGTNVVAAIVSPSGGVARKH